MDAQFAQQVIICYHQIPCVLLHPVPLHNIEIEMEYAKFVQLVVQHALHHILVHLAAAEMLFSCKINYALVVPAMVDLMLILKMFANFVLPIV